MKHHLKYPFSTCGNWRNNPGQKRKDSGFHIGPLIFLPQPRQRGSSTISGFGQPKSVQTRTSTKPNVTYVYIYIYNQLENNSNIANNNNDNDDNNNDNDNDDNTNNNDNNITCSVNILEAQGRRAHLRWYTNRLARLASKRNILFLWELLKPWLLSEPWEMSCLQCLNPKQPVYSALAVYRALL